MFFDTPSNPKDLWPIDSRWPRRRAEALLRRFQVAFPEILYDMSWHSNTLNAQAFIVRDQRRVRLLGGLARHRRLGFAGLALALAHETGHHLGGPPYDAHYSWLSSEERADTWALECGLSRVFPVIHVHSIAKKGVEEMAALKGCTVPPNSRFISVP